MKKILFLILLLFSINVQAFSTWFQDPIYYCTDDAVPDLGNCIETDWGCSYDYTSPSHAYDGSNCIAAPAPVSCTLPSINNRDVTSATYNTCIAPPVDYDCNSPKEWLYTAESSWKCAQVSALTSCGTAPYSATKAGVCVSGGIYHTTGFVKTLICDPANTYECKPPNSDCNFWTSIVDSNCTN